MICTKASRFLQRPQTVKHPGYYRHQSYFARHALSGFHLNESNLALLKVFGVEESQLLASAVKHDLLASGISSPAPGTARFTAPTGPFTKTGPLKGLESSYNLAGFTSTQLSQASKVSASKKRKMSEVYARMPSKISKKTVEGNIDKPVPRPTYKHYQQKGMSAERKFQRNARARELYVEKNPVRGVGGTPKKTLEQIK